MIKRERPPDNKIERQIVIGMITNTAYLRELRPIYDESNFKLSYAKTIARWCCEFFDEYKVAPEKNIADLFKTHASSLTEEEEESTKDFLQDINDEYENQPSLNIPYLIDKAEKHFRLNSLQDMKKELTQVLSIQDIDRAEELIGGYRRITKVGTEGVDPIRDTELIAATLDEAFQSEDLLFSLPGELGATIGDLERGFLMAVLGNPGSGKTWWLWFLGYLAVMSGFNVVFVNLEMTRKQMTKRILTTINGRPMKKYSGDILLPVFDCAYNQDNSCNKRERVCRTGILDESGNRPVTTLTDVNDFKRVKGYKPCTECRTFRSKAFEPDVWYRLSNRQPLSAAYAIKKALTIKRSMKRAGQFKMIEFPSGQLTVNDLRTKLNNLEYYEGFVPDVIITDYADKFRAPDTRVEYRNRIRDIWQEHKALGQERHALVITGSQTNIARESRGRDIRPGDWAEGIAKLEQIDAGLALNQSDEEKLSGIFRVSSIKQRHEEGSYLHQAMVLSQLRIGRPYLDSYILPPT